MYTQKLKQRLSCVNLNFLTHMFLGYSIILKIRQYRWVTKCVDEHFSNYYIFFYKILFFEKNFFWNLILILCASELLTTHRGWQLSWRYFEHWKNELNSEFRWVPHPTYYPVLPSSPLPYYKWSALSL